MRCDLFGGTKLVAERRVAWLRRHWCSQASRTAEPRQELVKDTGVAMAMGQGVGRIRAFSAR